MNLASLMACAICRDALTADQHDDTIIYRHAVTEDDHQPRPVNASLLKSVRNACHTCTAAPPVWNYRTSHLQIGTSIDGPIETYNEQWHVCLRCAQFIEADDSDGLTARCAGRMRWHPDSPDYAILRLLHRGIVLSRSERTLLTTTPWPPARFSAEMLPKVRDRLTGLLRGPANLPTPINDPGQRQALAARLDLIPMYWINQEYTAQVQAVTGEQPTAWINDELAPSDAGLLVWPEPVSHTRQLAAVSWTPQADGWIFIGYQSIGAGGGTDQDLMQTLRHEIGWLVPIHAEYIARGTGINGEHPLGPLATTWLFIHQRLTQTIAAKPDKPTTKAYARAKRPAPDIRIVQIHPRRAEPPQPADPTTGRSRAKPDHRFWVSGHERNQAYGPGRSLRQKIDIQPFLKGEEHLPIKLSTTVRVLGRRAEHDKAPGTVDD